MTAAPVTVTPPIVVPGGTGPGPGPIVTIKPPVTAHGATVHITALAVRKVHGRYVLQVRLSHSATLVVTLRRKGPGKKLVTIKRFRVSAKAGLTQLVLKLPAGHNKTYTLAVATVGSATTASTTRSTTFRKP